MRDGCWEMGHVDAKEGAMLRFRLGVCVSGALFSLGCGEVEPPSEAEEFCADYGEVCGFENEFGGEAYADESACVEGFEALTPVRQECALEHLTFADGGDAEENCPSAEGGDPCDRETTFCDQYAETCGFGNDFGGDPYEDSTDCRERFDELSSDRQGCVMNHLEFAVIEGDPDIHCPHAEGEPPCDENGDHDDYEGGE